MYLEESKGDQTRHYILIICLNVENSNSLAFVWGVHSESSFQTIL